MSANPYNQGEDYNYTAGGTTQVLTNSSHLNQLKVNINAELHLKMMI